MSRFYAYADDDDVGEPRITWIDSATQAARTARARAVLRDRGVRAGDAVAVVLPACPVFIDLLLAAAADGFSLVALNVRMSPRERELRLDSLAAAGDVPRVRLIVDDAGMIEGEPLPVGADADEDRREGCPLPAASSATAVIMFTSGTTGTPKAVPLSWANLCGSARASNERLRGDAPALWQAALPLYHVGGLQMVVRSLLAGDPFVLYRRFDAGRLLDDAAALGATHISVVDKTLRDLLDAAEGGSARTGALRAYRCLLLGGSAPNSRTLERARAAGARVFASYGMTETSSQIANAPVDASFTGALDLLPGYRARVLDAGEDGYGTLAVAGPGVAGGYLNAPSPLTADGELVTGDVARLEGGRDGHAAIRVRERVGDMFVSGGENIYPEEVRRALMGLLDVGDACVIGMPDERWGRRPVAFIEPDRPGRAVMERAGAARFAREVRMRAAHALSPLMLPDRIYALPALPRRGIGKVDRRALERIDRERLQVSDLSVEPFSIPLRHPIRTARALMTEREGALVTLTDYAGRQGRGECVAFSTDWYLPEILGDDLAWIREVAAPALAGASFSRPQDVAAFLAGLPGGAEHPLARGAVEPAYWELAAAVCGRPLWQLVREAFADAVASAARGADRRGTEGGADGAEADGAGRLSSGGFISAAPGDLPCGAVDIAAGSENCPMLVPAGASVGVLGPVEALHAARAAVEAGYTRLKMKVAPTTDSIDAVRAVRERYPQLMITLDANQGFETYDLEDRTKLIALDRLGVAWIEEPVKQPAEASCEERLQNLIELQRTMETPVCLDESLVTSADFVLALSRPELSVIALKPAKLGGIGPSIEFLARAMALGKRVWIGGMFETGVGRRACAALSALPGIAAPGDISEPGRYLAFDPAEPPYRVKGGCALID